MLPMPILPHVPDELLHELHTMGYSTGQSSWLCPSGRYYWQLEATKDGHRFFSRAGNRDRAVVELARMVVGQEE